MLLCLSRHDYDQLLLWAQNAHPSECCGLIWGHIDRNNDYRTESLEWTENVAEDPSQYFEIDPKALILAAKKERMGQKQLLGYFHSHPNGVLMPSSYDAEMADIIGMIWVIIADGEITAWLRQDGSGLHKAFKGIDIEIMA